MNASYSVSRQKANAILRKIATSTKRGGFGGAYTEDRTGASSASISAHYQDGEIKINSVLSREKVESSFNLL
jgi:hypothetical protein